MWHRLDESSNQRKKKPRGPKAFMLDALITITITIALAVTITTTTLMMMMMMIMILIEQHALISSRYSRKLLQ